MDYKTIYKNNLNNVLQFIDKKIVLKLLKTIKNNVPDEGFIILSGFTNEDPSYIRNKTKCFFKSKELIKIFKDFKIIYYFENMIIDTGHPGVPKSHNHGVVRIIAQKKN